MTRSQLSEKINDLLGTNVEGFSVRQVLFSKINTAIGRHLKTALAEQHKKTRDAAIEVVYEEIREAGEVLGIGYTNLSTLSNMIRNGIYKI